MNVCAATFAEATVQWSALVSCVHERPAINGLGERSRIATAPVENHDAEKALGDYTLDKVFDHPNKGFIVHAQCLRKPEMMREQPSHRVGIRVTLSSKAASVRHANFVSREVSVTVGR